MNPASALEKLKNLVVNEIGPEKLILHAPTAGWLLMGIAACTGIILNKEIKTKEKKFLVPQEIVDGSVNIGLYYLITTNLKKLTLKLVDDGKINFKNISRGSKKFGELKSCAGAAAVLAGGVISANILTPIVRNIFAADRQNKYLDSLKSPKSESFLAQRMAQTPFKIDRFVQQSRNSGIRI